MEQELNYIYEVYKAGSFSKAAENLYMTQPALSTAINKVEKNIGMTLFDRKKHPLRLTEAGTIYINSIKKMKHLEEEMFNQLYDIDNLITGNLRIGGSHYVNAYVLPKILKKYNEKYPGVKLELIESSSTDLAKMLTEKNIDVTFSCNELFIKNFERYIAFSDCVLLAVYKHNPLNKGLEEYALTDKDVVEKKHLLNNCPTVPIAQFKNAPFILLTPGNNLHYRAKKIFENGNINPVIKLEISQLATAFHLAAADYGVTFVSDRMISTNNIPLLYYKIDSPQIFRQFYALFKNQDYTPNAVKAFISLVNENTI